MQKIDTTNLDLRSLRILLSVAEGRSMSEVATDFNINQSTVSHTIDRLRTELNDPLFYRLGRNVMPTNFLLGAIDQLRNAVISLEALPKRDNFEPEDYRGTITISAHVTEILPQLTAFERYLHTRSPRARLRLLDLGSRNNLERVLETGASDLAISTRWKSYPLSLNSTELLSDRFAIYYDPDMRGPINTIEEYASARHATLDFGGDIPSTVDGYLAAMGLERKVVVGVPNVLCLAEIMKGTDLLCTMRERFSSTLLKGLACCPHPLDVPAVHFDILWHRRREHDPMVNWVRDTLCRVNVPQLDLEGNIT